MLIKVKKLRDNAALPSRGSAAAAGYDLRACLDAPVTIAPGETKMVGSGRVRQRLQRRIHRGAAQRQRRAVRDMPRRQDSAACRDTVS